MKLKLGEGLQIPIEVAGQAVALVGIRGSGKTNTAGVIAEELLDRGQPIAVLDPTDAWWGLRSDYPVFIFGGPHGDLPLNETDGKTLAEFVVQEKVPIILSLRHLRKGAQRRLVMEFCEELYHLKGKPEYREPLTVFIDEAPQFVPQRVMGEMARLVGAVQDMILLGRNAGFGVVLISQRFATLNADVRTQADTVIVHRLPSPLDRKALTEWIEENATLAEQKAVLSSLAMLKTGEAWIWAPYFDLFKRAQIRARKTFDSSAAPKRGAPARAPKDLTKVDLEKLKGKLAATIEKAKADDPKELRRKVAELTKALEISQREKIIGDPLKSKHASREKPVLTDADRALLEKLIGVLAHQREVLEGRLDSIRNDFSRRLEIAASALITGTVRSFEAELMSRLSGVETKGFQKILGKLATVAIPPNLEIHKFAGRRDDHTSRAPMGSRPPTTARSSPGGSSSRGPGVPAASSGTSSDLPKGARAVLIALAQRAEPLERDTLSALTGYKRSTRDLYLQQLARQGFVSDEAGGVTITADGLVALGQYDPLPIGAALGQHWLTRLPQGERTILQVLITAGGEVVSRDRLSDDTGYKRSTRDLYIQQLVRRRIAVTDRDGVRAAAELFD